MSTIQTLMNQIGYQQLMAPFSSINSSRLQSALGTTTGTTATTANTTSTSQNTAASVSTLPAAYDASGDNSLVPMMFSMMSMMLMMMQSLVGLNSASSLAKSNAVAEPAASTIEDTGTQTTETAATETESTSSNAITNDYSDPAVLQARQRELLGGQSPEIDNLLDEAAQQDPTSSDIETTYSHISQLWEGVGGSENALQQYFLLEAIRGVDANAESLLNVESIDSTAKQENLDAMLAARNNYLQQLTQLNQEAV
jgi:hypothetical protein